MPSFKNWSLPTSVLTRQETIERDIVVFEFTKIHESIDKVATAIDEAINDVENNSNSEPKASANETIRAVKNGESIQLDASELAVSKIFWRSQIWVRWSERIRNWILKMEIQNQMEELKDREEVLRLKEQALDSKRAKLQAKDCWINNVNFWKSQQIFKVSILVSTLIVS